MFEIALGVAGFVVTAAGTYFTYRGLKKPDAPPVIINNTVNPAPSPVVAPPPCAPTPAVTVCHIGYPPVACFTGREEELAWVAQTLTGSGARCAALLAGTGGVGKSAVAAEYAYRQKAAGTFALIWWVEAQTHDARARSFLNLAQELGLVAEDEDRKAEKARERVLAWLGRHGGWLLIYDNAERPKDLHGWLPEAGGGRVLITARRQSWSQDAEVRHVEAWSTQEAADFLLKRTKQTDREAAKELADRLGGLALACEQAAGFMNREGRSLHDYMETFDAEFAKRIEAAAPEGAHPSLGVTVRLGLEAAERHAPLAADLARALAWLAPDDIPRWLPDFWQGEEAAAVNAAVLALMDQGLARGEEDMLFLHRLTQDVLREQDPVPSQSAGRAARLLAYALNRGLMQYDTTMWSVAAALLPHATVLFSRLPDPAPEPRAVGAVCTTLGLFLKYAQGDAAATKAWYERALALGEKYLPDDDPDRAAGYLNLGAVLDDLGDTDGAIRQMRRVLEIGEAHFGTDHPQVAGAVNNLGYALHSKGDSPGATDCFERVLKIGRAQDPPDPKMIAMCLNNLGHVLHAQGRHREAEAHYAEALETAEAHFAADHPQVALCSYNFGYVRANLGDLTGGRELLRRAVAIWEKHLPPQHPDLLKGRNSLADVERRLASPFWHVRAWFQRRRIRLSEPSPPRGEGGAEGSG
jgi:tetratricopeptide (TPR) repeat protein